jgi:predicted GIY-YIG superfamily endonuclease
MPESPAFSISAFIRHKYDSIEGFTKKYQCHRLVYYESYQDVQVAISREKQIKRWRREKKIGLIEKLNPRWQDLAENWGREMRFRGQSLHSSTRKPRVPGAPAG